MTSLVTAQYDSEQQQILDPNSRGTEVHGIVNPVTGGSIFSSGTDVVVPETEIMLRKKLVLIGSSTFDGDRDERITYAYGPIAVGLALAGKPIFSTDVVNLAVGGTDIDELETQFAAALLLNPYAIATQCFSNDVASNALASALWPRYLALVNRAATYGIKVIGRVTHQRGLTTPQARQLMILRTKMLTLARTMPNQFYCIDAWSPSIDLSTGLEKTDYLNGIHLSNRGAFTEAKLWATLFGKLFPTPAYPDGDAAVAGDDICQRVVNPGLAGSNVLSGAGVSGLIPNNLTAGRFSGTGSAVGSIVTVDGVRRFRLTITPVAGDIFQIFPGVTLAGTSGTHWNASAKIAFISGCSDVIGTPRFYISGDAGIDYADLDRSATLSERKALDSPEGSTLTLSVENIVANSAGLNVYLYMHATSGTAVVVDYFSPSLAIAE